MSVLVTGANGVVGYEIAKKLSKKFKIIGIFRKKNLKTKVIKNIEWLRFDLKNKLNIKIKPKIKFVIHCAIDQTNLYKSNKSKYVNENIKIFKNVLNFAKKNKVKLFINLSSIDVYGKIKTDYLKEENQPKSQNIYGFTKFLLEKMLKESKLDYVNLRLPGILSEIKNTKQSTPFLNLIFYNLRFNRTLKIYGPYNKFNNVISTDEIVKFIFFLFKKKKIKGTFNFSSRKPILIKKILEISKKKLQSKSKIIYYKNEKIKSFCISTKKLEKKLRYKTSTTLKEINDYIKKLNDKVS